MKRIGIIFLACLIAFGYAGAVLASSTDGSISGYSFGNYLGWQNFGCDHCDGQVTDSAVTGYAWSDNYGWINLNPAQGGVVNDGNGNLSGSAWGEGIGWINFGGVIINSSGLFTGSASVDNGGSINFSCDNCNVHTDWRPASQRNSGGSGGGGVSSAPHFNLPPNPSAAFSAFGNSLKVIIDDNAAYTNSTLATLTFLGGSSNYRIIISNYQNLSDATTLGYQNTVAWNLLPGDGAKTVYAALIDSNGSQSKIISSAITLDTAAPYVTVTSIKNPYAAGQNIMLGGNATANSKISFSLIGTYEIFNVTSTGTWMINLGKLTAGTYPLVFTVTDLAGNQKSITINIVVTKSVTLAPPQAPKPQPWNILPVNPPSVVKNIISGISNILGITAPKKNTLPIVAIPQELPLVFKSKWNLLPLGSMNWVLLPLTPEK